MLIILNGLVQLSFRGKPFVTVRENVQNIWLLNNNSANHEQTAQMSA
jgi:hypothetical protein